jgi:hypothetical protein
MEPNCRKSYNDSFTEEAYHSYVNEINEIGNGQLDFRIAETPVFVSNEMKAMLLEAGEEILDFLTSDTFLEISKENNPFSRHWPDMLVMDFGICKTPEGDIEPRLIELQGFPSLYAFEFFQDQQLRNHFTIPSNFSSYLNGYTPNEYQQLLRDIIIGPENTENVILLELFPDKQKTRIDFHCTEKLLGIKTVCITTLSKEGDHLYYQINGKKFQIKRIFNRVIPDEWKKHNDILPFDPFDTNGIIWLNHPSWYYSISKQLLPYLDSRYVPKAFFLDELTTPLPLEKYVLKPLFSYAGTGVVLSPDETTVNDIAHPHQWILQEKMEYAKIIMTPDIPAKTEIRLFYFRKKEWTRPRAIHNLARLSKGEMIGTRYNKDHSWVGGSIAYFEC